MAAPIQATILQGRSIHRCTLPSQVLVRIKADKRETSSGNTQIILKPNLQVNLM